MEGLLDWDFSPGQAVEAQVRARFGSTVHFSPYATAKEFFLVVAFSSASFTLSVESVGLALQCCIGGSDSGFNVKHLVGRQFRFSVASNKVGHFIYGLKDRVWPSAISISIVIRFGPLLVMIILGILTKSFLKWLFVLLWLSKQNPTS